MYSNTTNGFSYFGQTAENFLKKGQYLAGREDHL